MKFIATFLLLLVYVYAPAQYISFPLDTSTVTIDGVLQLSEWKNANTVMIPVNTTDSVQVMYKHDLTAMYFAYMGKLESANALFPELMTDAENKGGTAWVNGQWWFHVSATDCENDGGYGVYNNCKTVQPDWEGAPNFTPGLPLTDTVEIKIPFAKTGFNPATMDTMGIAFMVTNTANIFRMHPAAADRNRPATWAKATFSKVPAGVNDTRPNEIKLYPNPATDVLYINGVEPGSKWCLKNFCGSVLLSGSIMENRYEIDLSEYAAGIYFVEIIHTDSGRTVYTFSKQ